MPFHSTPAGGSSSASTVPAGDAEALANAKQGTEEVRAYDALRATEQSPPAPQSSSVHPLVRANSMPILATPQDRIRRQGTLSKIPETIQPAPNMTPAPEGGEGSHDPKKRKIDKTTPTETPAPVHPDASAATAAPQAVEGVASDPKPPATEQPTKNGESTVPGGTTAAPEPPAPVNTKPAAKKAAAKPPSSHTDENETANGNETHDAGNSKGAAQALSRASTQDYSAAVKTQATPMRSESTVALALEQASKDNLARSSTLMQETPSPSPAGTPHPAQADDVETLLDKEVKREPTEHSPIAENNQARKVQPWPHDKEAYDALETLCSEIGLNDNGQGQTVPAATASKQVEPAKPAGEATPAAPGQQQPQSKGRKEKTPEQKAAHARYMRFSRSFTRALLWICMATS